MCSAQFLTSQYWASADCSGSILFINAVFDVSGSCQPASCAPVTGTPGVGSSLQECGGSPDVPKYLNAFSLYSQQNCQGGVTAVQAYPTVCTPYDIRSTTVVCTASDITITSYLGSTCNGTPSVVTYGSCTNDGSQSYSLLQCDGSRAKKFI